MSHLIFRKEILFLLIQYFLKFLNFRAKSCRKTMFLARKFKYVYLKPSLSILKKRKKQIFWAIFQHYTSSGIRIFKLWNPENRPTLKWLQNVCREDWYCDSRAKNWIFKKKNLKWDWHELLAAKSSKIFNSDIDVEVVGKPCIDLAQESHLCE